MVVANRYAALPDDLGEHDLVTECGDLDESRAEAGIADRAGPDAPAMIAADLSRVPVIMPGACHQRLALRAAGCG